MPPVPGAVLIRLGSVFSAAGVPTRTVKFFLGVIPLRDMVCPAINVSRNVVSSLLLARKFDMWDEKIFMKDW